MDYKFYNDTSTNNAPPRGGFNNIKASQKYAEDNSAFVSSHTKEKNSESSAPETTSSKKVKQTVQKSASVLTKVVAVVAASVIGVVTVPMLAMGEVKAKTDFEMTETAVYYDVSFEDYTPGNDLTVIVKNDFTDRKSTAVVPIAERRQETGPSDQGQDGEQGGLPGVTVAYAEVESDRTDGDSDSGAAENNPQQADERSFAKWENGRLYGYEKELAPGMPYTFLVMDGTRTIVRDSFKTLPENSGPVYDPIDVDMHIEGNENDLYAIQFTDYMPRGEVEIRISGGDISRTRKATAFRRDDSPYEEQPFEEDATGYVQFMIESYEDGEVGFLYGGEYGLTPDTEYTFELIEGNRILIRETYLLKHEEPGPYYDLIGVSPEFGFEENSVYYSVSLNGFIPEEDIGIHIYNNSDERVRYIYIGGKDAYASDQFGWAEYGEDGIFGCETGLEPGKYTFEIAVGLRIIVSDAFMVEDLPYYDPIDFEEEFGNEENSVYYNFYFSDYVPENDYLVILFYYDGDVVRSREFSSDPESEDSDDEYGYVYFGEGGIHGAEYDLEYNAGYALEVCDGDRIIISTSFTTPEEYTGPVYDPVEASTYFVAEGNTFDYSVRFEEYIPEGEILIHFYGGDTDRARTAIAGDDSGGDNDRTGGVTYLIDDTSGDPYGMLSGYEYQLEYDTEYTLDVIEGDRIILRHTFSVQQEGPYFDPISYEPEFGYEGNYVYYDFYFAEYTPAEEYLTLNIYYNDELVYNRVFSSDLESDGSFDVYGETYFSEDGIHGCEYDLEYGEVYVIEVVDGDRIIINEIFMIPEEETGDPEDIESTFEYTENGLWYEISFNGYEPQNDMILVISGPEGDRNRSIPQGGADGELTFVNGVLTCTESGIYGSEYDLESGDYSVWLYDGDEIVHTAAFSVSEANDPSLVSYGFSPYAGGVTYTISFNGYVPQSGLVMYISGGGDERTRTFTIPADGGQITFDGGEALVTADGISGTEYNFEGGDYYYFTLYDGDVVIFEEYSIYVDSEPEPQTGDPADMEFHFDPTSSGVSYSIILNGYEPQGEIEITISDPVGATRTRTIPPESFGTEMEFDGGTVSYTANGIFGTETGLESDTGYYFDVYVGGYLVREENFSTYPEEPEPQPEPFDSSVEFTYSDNGRVEYSVPLNGYELQSNIVITIYNDRTTIIRTINVTDMTGEQAATGGVSVVDGTITGYEEGLAYETPYTFELTEGDETLLISEFSIPYEEPEPTIEANIACFPTYDGLTYTVTFAYGEPEGEITIVISGNGEYRIITPTYGSDSSGGGHDTGSASIDGITGEISGSEWGLMLAETYEIQVLVNGVVVASETFITQQD